MSENGREISEQEAIGIMLGTNQTEVIKTENNTDAYWSTVAKDVALELGIKLAIKRTTNVLQDEMVRRDIATAARLMATELTEQIKTAQRAGKLC
jgi:uncharacterized protein (DUF2236 family)